MDTSYIIFKIPTKKKNEFESVARNLGISTGDLFSVLVDLAIMVYDE